MTVDIYVLSLLAAASWGVGTVLSKPGLNAGGSPIQSALTVEVVSAGLYWLLIALRGDSLVGLTIHSTVLFVLAGGIGTALGRLVHYTGVQRVGASITSAGINVRPLFATLLAVVFLGEVLHLPTAGGILVVLVGLVLLSLSRGGDIRGWNRRDLLFPLGAALAYAGGNVVRRAALVESTATPIQGVMVNATAAVIVLVAYILLSGKTMEAPGRAYGFFAVGGLANAAALLFLFEALDRGPVVIVDPLSGTSSLFALLFTYFFLHDLERITLLTVIGAVCIVLGVVLITLL